MATYLESNHFRDTFATADTVVLTARCWYLVLYKYFSHIETQSSAIFFVFALLDKPLREPERRFPTVEYQYFSPQTEKCGRSTRVVLVEVMDPRDPELSWDVKSSFVYGELRKLDAAHPERKCFGALSAGSHFVLFEATGTNDPAFLVGEPSKLAHFIEDAEALEKAMCDIREVAVSGGCKCSDPDPEPFPRSEELTHGPGEVVNGPIEETAYTTQPGPHDAESASFTSGAAESPAVSVKSAPVTSGSESTIASVCAGSSSSA